jgi:uracil-DNA glycosylase family 4
MSSNAKGARELLAFYVEAGADALLGEAAVDRMADEIAPPPAGGRPDSAAARVGENNQRTAAGHSPIPDRWSLPSGGAERRPVGRSGPLPAGESNALLPPDTAIMAAREAARTAANLDELRALLESFEGCALRNTATQLVFADGNPQGRIMFVGEAPGHEEDISGRPFVGRSGKLLDRMIEAIGLDRSKVYIANVVPWRPPGNRTPTPQETAICLPFIRRQIELADPDILVCLGGPSMQTLLGTKDGITRMRGRWFPFDTGTREIKAMATFHPAFLLRSPLQKRFSWRDFLAIKKALAQ